MREWRLVSDHIDCVVALGGFTWQVVAPGGRVGDASRGSGYPASLPSWECAATGCYHEPAQATGRLTPTMLDDREAKLAGIE